jgi:hypothetical protein
MELYTFYVFLSIIVMPDGELKSLVRNVVECPPVKLVEEMHEPRMATGEIVDWSATCLHAELPLKIPQGLKT